MTIFDKRFFQHMDFSERDLARYLENAKRDLGIAREDVFAEVVFSYAYQALIKGGIAVLAKTGSVKVRSVPGHHVKILEKLSEVLANEDVLALGNAMRMKRNLDFYGGGEIISEKEAQEYFRFVEETIKTIEERYFSKGK